MSRRTAQNPTVLYLASEITEALNRHKERYGHRKCPIDVKWHLHIRQSELNQVMNHLRKTMPRIRREGRFLMDPAG